MINKWDHRFYRTAQDVAKWSKDSEQHVGAVLVSPDGRQVSWGFNGLPKGVADTAERLGDRETKNRLTIHAELNAILNSRRDLSGWTLYVTKPPCVKCALAIIQAGVTCVVCPPMCTSSRWCDDQNVAKGLLMEAGVSYHCMFEEETGE